MTSRGIITRIQRCSTEDGPGIRTTVFLKGCPLSCTWCHNIETIDAKPRIVWHPTKCIGDRACIEACIENNLDLTDDGMIINWENCTLCASCEKVCPTGAIELIGTSWMSNPLIHELLRDKVFFTTSKGGVTISGGEPLSQSQFAIDVMEGLRYAGTHVALDTSGYASETIWRNILEHVDLVLLDLKNMDADSHLKQTGVPLDRILSNAKILAETDIPVWIRTPIIPGHTDSESNIEAIARFIIENMPNVERYDLLSFNKMCVEKYALFGLEYPLKDYDLIQADTMERLASIPKRLGVKNVTWSGMTKTDPQGNKAQNQEARSCG
ncbi:MAG: glycyl-radical enzyme activating protein [Candidatus Thorarchaeota archaeon]